LLCKIKNQKGVALIASLAISLILMLVAIAISYRVGMFTRRTSVIEKKEQVDFATDYGLSLFRFYLWDRNCNPPEWGGQDGTYCQGENQNGTKLTENGYADVTSNLRVFPNGNSYISSTQITLSDNSVFAHHLSGSKGHIHFNWSKPNWGATTFDYSVFARKTKNPQILDVMVSANKRHITGSFSSENEYLQRTTIETAIYFDEKLVGYNKQKRQGKEKTGLPIGVSGINTSNVSTY